ncbi:MAG TPA: glycosyltransferase family 1 protein, partial [Chloroflexota bacterium]
MRIAIDYTAAINQSGGIGRFVRDLVGALAEADTADQYVLLHARPNPGREVTVPGGANFSMRSLPVPERWATILWHRAHLHLPVEMFTGPVDLFHAPDFTLPPVRRARTLVTVHDLAFLLRPESAQEGLRLYLEQVVPRSIARADYVLTDSENTRNDVICLMDAAPERVFVIPGGVAPMFRPASEDAIENVCRARGIARPYILSAGTIQPRKNYPTLIEAYDRLRTRTHLPHQLVIAGGRGWLTDATFERAGRSAFHDDIHFAGFVPDEELIALYSGASVFAYPSYYEGSGLPIWEAMACGAPVVCSNTSCLPECAGDAALLVSPDD